MSETIIVRQTPVRELVIVEQEPQRLEVSAPGPQGIQGIPGSDGADGDALLDWDLRRFGATFDGTTDDTDAWVDALSEAQDAVDAGYGVELVMPEGKSLVDTLLQWPDKWCSLRGSGREASIIKCTSAGAGLAVGDDVGGGFGNQGHFTGFGVDGNLLSTVGLRFAAVGSHMEDVAVTRVDGDGMRVLGQNCDFVNVTVLDCSGSCLVLDNGTGGHEFLRCEIAMADEYHLAIRESAEASVNAYRFPALNIFRGCIFEYAGAPSFGGAGGGLGCVLHTDGAENKLVDPNFFMPNPDAPIIKFGDGTTFANGPLRLVRPRMLGYTAAASSTPAITSADFAGVPLAETTEFALEIEGDAYFESFTSAIEWGSSSFVRASGRQKLVTVDEFYTKSDPGASDLRGPIFTRPRIAGPLVVNVAENGDSAQDETTPTAGSLTIGADDTGAVAPAISAIFDALNGSFVLLEKKSDSEGGTGDSVSFSADGFDARGNVITGVADGVDPSDAVNKGQLDAVDGGGGGGGSGSLSVPSVQAFGHSLIAGYGTTTYPDTSPSPTGDAGPNKYGMPERLAHALGNGTMSRLAKSGGLFTAPNANGGIASLLQSSIWATDLVAGPYMAPGGLKVSASPANDWAAMSYGSNGEDLVEYTLRALYAAQLAARKVNALKAGPALNTPTLTYTGTWTAFADTTISTGLGFAYTATNGDKVELALDAAYDGEAITCLLPITNTVNTPVMTLAVDGVDQVSIDETGVNSVMGSLTNPGTVLGLRIPAGTISPGTHTVRLTVTGLGGGEIGAFGGFIIEDSIRPLLVMGAMMVPGDSTTSNKFIWANDRAEAVVAEFPSAAYVDFAAAITPNYGTANENDDLVNFNVPAAYHPNNLGYALATEAVLAAATPLLTPTVVSQMS